MKNLIRTALFATAALAATPAFAADAFTSFNGTNGNGGFSYGTTNGTTLLPFTVTGPNPGVTCAFGSASICLQPATDLNQYHVPQASVNGSYPTVLDVGTNVVLHPGNTDAESVYGAYQASTTGLYGYSITLTTLGRDSGTGIGFRSFLSEGGIVLGVGPRSTNSTVPGSSLTFSGTQLLTAGESFGIIIDRNGDFGGDSTGLKASISAVPEPATWAMMVMGFGMVGFGLRSSRKSKVSKVAQA